MLFRLLYISTAADTVNATELQAILDGAQTRNAQLNLTGLLVYTGKHFMQLLEGEREAVEAVFASICADERHSAIAKLIAEPARERACPDWSMALRTLEAGETAPEAIFTANDTSIRESLPATMPGDLRLLFQSFNSLMTDQSQVA